MADVNSECVIGESTHLSHTIGVSGFLCTSCNRSICYRHATARGGFLNSFDWRKKVCICGGKLKPVSPEYYEKMNNK